jgi:hypothetical protein
MAVPPGQSWKQMFARAPIVVQKMFQMICRFVHFKLGSASMEGRNSLSPLRVAVAGCGVYREPQSGGTRADLFKAATFHSLSDSTFTTT